VSVALRGRNAAAITFDSLTTLGMSRSGEFLSTSLGCWEYIFQMLLLIIRGRGRNFTPFRAVSIAANPRVEIFDPYFARLCLRWYLVFVKFSLVEIESLPFA
jgi:hypothetical protein